MRTAILIVGFAVVVGGSAQAQVGRVGVTPNGLSTEIIIIEEPWNIRRPDGFFSDDSSVAAFDKASASTVEEEACERALNVDHCRRISGGTRRR